jgi:hypothetical protein
MKEISHGDKFFRELFTPSQPENKYYKNFMFRDKTIRATHPLDMYWNVLRTKDDNKTDDIALLLNEVLSRTPEE